MQGLRNNCLKYRREKVVDQLPHHTSAIDAATQPSARALPSVPVFSYESKHYGIYEQSEKPVEDDKRDEKQAKTKDENQDEVQGDDEKQHESQVDDEKQDDCQDDDENWTKARWTVRNRTRTRMRTRARTRTRTIYGLKY